MNGEGNQMWSLLSMIFLLIRHSKKRSHRLSVRTVGFHPTKRFDSLGPPNIMHKVAIIEKIHKDGIDLLKNNPNFEFEIIETPLKKT